MTNAIRSTAVFDFNALHNSIQCIESLKPEDRGTERQFWFSAKMLAEAFACTTDTIRSRVETLINTGDVDGTKNLVSLTNVQEFGYNQTTIYNLTVFNKLAMTFIDKPRAVEMRKAFNDVLVKRETQTPMMVLPKDYLSALKALVASEEARVQAEAERDAAIKTKTLYQEGLASRMSGRVGGLTKANLALKAENESLKDAVGRGGLWRTVSMMKAEWIKEFGHAPVWQKLKQFSADVKIEPVKDVEEKLVLANGTEKITLSYRYHREAWARYRKYEENLRTTEAEIEAI